ncbi:hypothetical protein [Microbacterium sp.]|uniref:hypothetical protein n=1 Tax=Microbacterium sp. TaxID=51671 RepID=UPI002811C6A8|nr:hypothetical protein [Microbacterium sp.]
MTESVTPQTGTVLTPPPGLELLSAPGADAGMCVDGVCAVPAPERDRESEQG